MPPSIEAVLPPIDEPSYLPGCEHRDRHGNKCGEPVKFATGRFCEDCAAGHFQRFSGKAQSVNTISGRPADTGSYVQPEDLRRISNNVSWKSAKH